MTKLSLPKTFTGYLAPEDFVDQVINELKHVVHVRERLVLAKGTPQPSFWAQNIWLNPETHSIQSINHAVKTLKGIQRNWCLYSSALHRRAGLIQQALPHVSAKPLHFPSPLPKSPLGSWTLLDQDTILASTSCSSPFPNGEIHFVENKTEPPSRAYLKLWEVFTLLGEHPEKGQSCLDAGSSPGGWTWVLSELGAKVLSVDRTALEPSLMRRREVTFRKGDAFSVVPSKDGTFDWLFCDVACYPEKLFEWVRPWWESGKVQRFVCTIKFQGRGRDDIVRRFAAIPGSKLIHLFNNKHELTWVNYRRPLTLPFNN